MGHLSRIGVTLAGLLVFFGLAWLSNQYPFETDMTHNAANTLSPATQKLLQSLPDNVEVTVYIKKGKATRQQIAQLIDRYSRFKPNMTLAFVDPDAEPDKIRELQMGAEGMITISYQGRVEKINFIDESTLTNTLLQLAHAKQRWITCLTGHGERSAADSGNFNLSAFSKELSRRNIQVLTVNLATMHGIPDNSSLLVIAAPSVSLMAGEKALIKAYIEHGGNLLLLTDPGNTAMADIMGLVGIKQYRGTLVDNNYALYGVTDPSFIIATEYVGHPITQDFRTITLYPKAAALAIATPSPFTANGIFFSTAKSWTEVGEIKGKIGFDYENGEQQGPLPFAYALTRTVGSKQQRILVVGDGDFLANAYLGNVGNLDMGFRMVNWLIHDDQFIGIPAKTSTDKSLQLSGLALGAMAFGFLIIMPVLLFGAGLWIWFCRRRH